MRLLPLLLLAACTPAEEAAIEANAVAPVASAVADPAPAASPTVPETAATAAPTEVRTFGDWAVACDNGRACRATALAAENAGLPFTLAIDRAASPSASPEVHIDNGGSNDADTVNAIDGALVTGALTAAALANGRTFTVTPATGRPETVSLTGLSASLRYMDDIQRRAGTVTAIVARGARLASSVPAAPPLPRIVQPAPTRTPPRTLSVAEATRLIGPDYARCDDATDKVEPAAYRLDADHSVVVVAHPCGNGAYNSSSSVFVVDEAGRATPALLDASAGMDPDDRHLIVNGDWDPATRRLSSHSKGRGVGDCGVSQSFAWDGTRFRLAAQAEMSECRGSTDFLPTWRAAVVTG